MGVQKGRQDRGSTAYWTSGSIGLVALYLAYNILPAFVVQGYRHGHGHHSGKRDAR